MSGIIVCRELRRIDGSNITLALHESACADKGLGAVVVEFPRTLTARTMSDTKLADGTTRVNRARILTGSVKSDRPPRRRRFAFESGQTELAHPGHGENRA